MKNICIHMLALESGYIPVVIGGGLISRTRPNRKRINKKFFLFPNKSWAHTGRTFFELFFLGGGGNIDII